jgi:hypothetical protein
MPELNWEMLASKKVPNAGNLIHIYRSRVPGGWLVFANQGGGPSGLTFVPDPHHTWNGGSV